MKSKLVKSFIIMVLLMCLMVTPCYAIMMPQDILEVIISKTVYSPNASSYSLIYSFDPSPYQVYRYLGRLAGTSSSEYTNYYQFRDNSGNVIYSTTVGSSDKVVDVTFTTAFSGFNIYAYCNDPVYSSKVFGSHGIPVYIYYGSNIAEQADMEATLTAANTAATNATNAYTAANTAASRALNNYNILNNTTKGLYKTYDIANVAVTNTSYGGNTAAYLAYLASEDAGYVRDTLIPSMQTDINNLATTVNTINNTISGDSIAPMIKSLAGENGATCTTTGTFYVVVSASDNSSGTMQAQASVDGGAYGALVTLPNSIPVSLSGGAHTITVRVQDEVGNTTTETMTAFAL